MPSYEARRRGRAALATLVAWNAVLAVGAYGLGHADGLLAASRRPPPPPQHEIPGGVLVGPQPGTRAPATGTQTATPAAGVVARETPPASEAEEARARALLDGLKDEVDVEITRERFDAALDLFARVAETIGRTKAWKDGAAPMVARLAALRRAQGDYESALPEMQALLDTGDVAGAKAIVDAFPDKESPFFGRLKKHLERALAAGASVAARPRVEDPGEPLDKPDRPDGPVRPKDPARGKDDPPAKLGLMAGHVRLEGKTWALESALVRPNQERVLLALETAGKLAQKLFDRKRKQGEPLPRAIVFKEWNESRAAALGPQDIATTTRQGEELDELIDRIVLLAARKLVERGLGGGVARTPAWVVPGVTRFLSTFTVGARGEVACARRADAWRRRFLEDPPRDDGTTVRNLVQAPPAAKLDERDHVRSWALAFFALASDDARQSPLQKQVVAYLRKVASDAQLKTPPQEVARLKLLEDLNEKNASTFEHAWRDYVDWGDVERPEIQEDAAGWLFARFQRYPVKVRTNIMNDDFTRSVGFFFGTLFRGYDRFYQDRLGLTQKNVNECTIRIFKSTDEFQEFARKKGMKILRPHYIPGERETAMPCDDANVRSIEQTLYHELGHRWNEVYFPMAPTWFEEGMASYLGGTRRELSRFEFGECSGFLSVARGELEAGTLDDLPTLMKLTWEQFHSEPREMARYAESCSVIHWLLEADGESADPEATARFFKNAPGGRANVAGLEAAFGKPIDVLEKKWRAHLKRR